jgi:hypothetical protein
LAWYRIVVAHWDSAWRATQVSRHDLAQDLARAHFTPLNGVLHGVTKSQFTKTKWNEIFFETIMTATKVEEINVIGTAAGSISIMAPSHMPGGYEFFADAGNGSSYKVRVVRTEANERKHFVFVQCLA